MLESREFLMLAKIFKPDDHDLSGWYFSDKLDGIRAYWDGGISRGLATESIPWANILQSTDGKRKKKIKPIATGLWSQYGNPIMTPDWFLNKLPCCPLDGMLWAGRKNFNLCRSICAGYEPDSRFDKIQFAVFDSPPLSAIFRDGQIKSASFLAQLNTSQIKKWFQKRVQDASIFEDFQALERSFTPFEDRLMWLREKLPEEGRIFISSQNCLSPEWRSEIETELTRNVEDGGEGLVFRNPAGLWEPVRSTSVLDYNPYKDVEAIIQGVVAGKTDSVLGKIGALICEARFRPSREYVTFNVVLGISKDQRELNFKLASWAKKHPGTRIPIWDIFNDYPENEIINESFRMDDRITIKYRGLTDDGKPIEPRFWKSFRGEGSYA